MDDNVKLAIKVSLITFAVLMFARVLAQQVGYGFTNGIALAAKRHEEGN